jgi:hypothetical protein
VSKDRDAYELEETPARKHTLAQVLAGELACPRGGDPVFRGTVPPGTHPMVVPEAYRDLARAGLVIGDVITGRGYRAAQDWGLDPGAHFRKAKGS